MVAPKKKIFVGFMSSGNILIPATDGLLPIGYGPFVAEEDITVIGWTGRTLAAYANPITAVGLCAIYCYLCSGYVQVYINLLDTLSFIVEQSAVSISHHYERSNVMFPEGEGISLKEGEHLELNCCGNNATATIVGASFEFSIFYVKGSRS